MRKFIIKTGKDGQKYFNLKGGNGEKLFYLVKDIQ
jgi:uncharacterized protein YegP (UPF0339 family)